MSETAVFILIGCFFLFFIALEVVMLIIGHKRAAEYTLEKPIKRYKMNRITGLLRWWQELLAM